MTENKRHQPNPEKKRQPLTPGDDVRGVVDWDKLLKPKDPKDQTPKTSPETFTRRDALLGIGGIFAIYFTRNVPQQKGNK